MAKPTRPAAQLQTLLQQRIDEIPELRGQITDIRAGVVVGIDSGPGAPNWTVRRVSNQNGHRADIARVLRELQQRYDLEGWPHG